MKHRFFILGFLLCVRATAHAQDAGQVGVTMGYPGSVGILWHVSDTIAVRPEIGFATSSTSDSGFPTGFTTVTTGASGLYYLSTWEQVRAYVSPHFSYARSTSDSAGSILLGSTSSMYGLTGSFGAQYNPHKRFAVYGEVGLGYSHNSSESSSTVIQTRTVTSTSWNTRTGVGVVFYFK
jgi:hypothetical protein